MKDVEGKRVVEIESSEVVRAASLYKENEDPKRIDNKYPMSFNFEFIAGKHETKAVHLQPPVTFRPKHLVSNLRESNVAFLESLQCANIQCLLGRGLDLNSMPDLDDPILGVPIDFPVMEPQNVFCLQVAYTGRIPPHITYNLPFIVCVTLVGPALYV